MSELCEAYGFTRPRLRARCALLGLDEHHKPVAEQFHARVLVPHATAVVDELFEQLLADREIRAILGEDFSIDHLKAVMVASLRRTGIGFDSIEYCEDRLRIGLTHARVGVPIGIYLSTYSVLLSLLSKRIPAQSRESMEPYLHKITGLDVSIASEGYYIRRVRLLEAEMDLMRRREQRLLVRAQTDALTGLVNRETVLAECRRSLRSLRRDAHPFCAMMVDLDHFKQVNDDYGHPVGDQVLKEVAARMRSAVRDFDIVGRYGGEEFLVVLNTTAIEQGLEVAERMRLRVGTNAVVVSERAIPLTISVGIAAARSDESLDALVRRADQALYEAKQGGRNRVVVAKAEAL